MQANKITFVKCGLVLSFLLIVCYGIRHRQRIVEEIDATYRCYDSWKRNSNLDRIITLPILKDNPDEWYVKHRVIAHGGGGIDGKTCTDSREAIELAYSNGTRMFDIDILETIDHVWVCRHGWLDNLEQDARFRAGETRTFQWDIEQLRYNLQPENAKRLDYRSFMQTKPYHKYTPITLNDFIAFMKKHDDVWLIADLGYSVADKYKKLYNSMLKNLSFDVKQRIVVTFNLYEDAAKIRKISPNVKLQLKRYGMKDENYYDVAKFCIDNDVHALNLSVYNVKDSGIKYLNSRGIHVFFAAVDFLSDYQYCISQGASGIVSNFLFENDLRLYKRR